MASSQGLELLEKCIKSSAIQSFFLAAFSLVAGAGLLVGAVTQIVDAKYDKAGFMGLGGLVMLGAAWALFQGGRELWPARSARAYAELAGDARGVAWAYMTLGKSNGVKLCFLDGDEVSISASRSDSEALMKLIQQRAPHAILGYGPAQQKIYIERVKSGRSAGQARA